MKEKTYKKNILPCGCKINLGIVVRRYSEGICKWGYACQCGKYFKEYGSWQEAKNAHK